MTATRLNPTHDAQARSWLASANGSDFPIQNLPYGRFRRAGSQEKLRCGVAIGDQVIDLARLVTQTAWLNAAGVDTVLATRAVQAATQDLRDLMRKIATERNEDDIHTGLEEGEQGH